MPPKMSQGEISSSTIFSATYSNVPVYEFSVNGNHVMRRRSDNWINATHILKVADFDKPARTRILEREVQRGVHEKVQGGYGKYQGTWVPLPDGRDLAQRNGVLEALRPIFDFVPGDQSPPQAPKHTTAASNRPKVPRAVAHRKVPSASSAPPRRGATNKKIVPPPSHRSEDQFDAISTQLEDEDMRDNSTIASESMLADDDMLQMSQQSTGSRKRKRGNNVVQAFSHVEQQNMAYADELLDYFIISADDPAGPNHPPEPPPHFEVDSAIDDQGHTALHWAASMGDLNVVGDLLQRGANMAVVSKTGMTPLMRAVLFTNNFEKETMPKLTSLLQPTVGFKDWYGSTVFHHIAATTSSRSRFLCARYYFETMINKLSETMAENDITALLNAQDQAGDTALIIAARNGARKCVRSLIGHNAAVEVQNGKGETADDLLRELNSRRSQRFVHASSSPFQADGGPNLNATAPDTNSINGHSHSHPARHYSEAAIAVTEKLAPLITSQASKLASAFDSELRDRDADLAEAQRLLKNMEQEILAVQKQIYLHTTSREEEDGPAADAALQAQYEALVAENESLLEQSQRTALKSLVESNLHNPAYNSHSDNDSPSDGDAANHERNLLRQKLQLAAALREQQNERRKLIHEVIQSQAAAGLGYRHADYKRLMAGALQMTHEELEKVLPELLRELETSQSDGATGVSDVEVEGGFRPNGDLTMEVV